MKFTPRYKKGDKIGGRYLVHQALMGGMGEVYLCLDLEENLPLALKTFQQRYLTATRLRAAFEHEVATWIALEKHPNIVQCLGMTMFNNQPFMYLEWITNDENRGIDLRSWLRSGSLELRLTLDFTMDICRGLIHAQKKQSGIVHRDLKPDNILIGQGQLAKITDFGLAKIVQEANLEISNTTKKAVKHQSLFGQGGIIGTPPYMPPEQWRGETLDARTDIYAVGCILYEMLTGHQLFHATTLEGFRNQHFEANIPKVADKQDLPRALDILLANCLAKQKEMRFTTVHDLFQELSVIYRQLFDSPYKETPSQKELNAFDYTNRGMTYSLLQCYDKALEDHNCAIKLKPDFGGAYANRGITNYLLHRYNDALEDFNHAIEVEPKNASFHNNRGLVYDSLQHYDQALADFTYALQLSPSYAKAYNNRGKTYAEIGRYEEALLDFNNALRFDPSYMKAYLGRGSVYFELERYEEALSNFNIAIEIDPNLAQAYENRGRIYIKQKKFKDALANFNRAIETEPDNAKFYHSRGVIYSELHQYDKALADLDRAIQLDPYSADSYVNRGSIYEQMQRYEEALADHSHAIEIDSTNGMGYYNRGVVWYRIQHYEEAIADFKLSIEFNPDYAPSYLNLGVLFYGKNSLQEALAYFEKAEKLGDTKGKEYATHIRKMLNMEPTIKPEYTQFSIIDSFLKANTLEELRLVLIEYPFMTESNFIKFLEKFIAEKIPPAYHFIIKQRLAWLRQIVNERTMKSENATNSQVYYKSNDKSGTDEPEIQPIKELEQRIVDLNEKGAKLSNSGQEEEALIYYDQALELHPYYTEAWYNKGNALNKLGRNIEALDCYEHALKLNPQLEQAWIGKGITLAVMKQYPEALSSFNSALEINPQDVTAWYNKGVVLGELGQTQEELNCYNHVLNLNPSDAKAWSNKGVALQRLGQYKESLICYDRVLELAPNQAEAWTSKGAALNELGRNEEAIICYNQAIKLNPHYVAAWSNKGNALDALGRAEEALICYDRALELDSHDVGVWYNKGITLLNNLQRYREALTCFEKAKQLGHPQGAEAILLCRQMLRAR